MAMQAGSLFNTPVPDSYIDAIKRFEGFTPKASWDVNNYRNGYGTNARHPGEQIDQQEAERRLQDELYKASSLVDSSFPNLPQGVRAGLVDLTFNAGSKWMNSGLGDLVRSGDYTGAADRIKQYNKSDGVPLQGLIDRRGEASRWMLGFAPTAGGAPTVHGGGSMTPTQNSFALLPQAAETLSVPEQYRQPPVNFTDDPLGWLNGRNSAGYNVPNRLLAAAAALSAVNNPKGAEVYAQMAKSDDEAFTAHMDANGNVLQVGNKGTIRQWRVPTAIKPVEAPGAKALAEADSKRWSEMKGEIYDTASKAEGRLGDLNTLETALKHPGLYQGPGGTQLQELKKFVAANPMLKGAFGDTLDLSSVGPGDIANRIQAMGILQMRDPKGGYGGMPGAFTEKEWERLAKANAGLDNSHEGNLLMIMSERIMRERQKQMGEWLTNYLERTGGAFDDVSWQRYKQQMIKENPIADFEKLVSQSTPQKAPGSAANTASQTQQAPQASDGWKTAPTGGKYRMVQ